MSIVIGGQIQVVRYGGSNCTICITVLIELCDIRFLGSGAGYKFGAWIFSAVEGSYGVDLLHLKCQVGELSIGAARGIIACFAVVPLHGWF